MMKENAHTATLSLPQQIYLAHWLTLSLPSSSLGKLTASLQDAQVDLTPHQVDAALFAFKSPLSKGAILADEVGLGKTIEAGIILSQFWAEHRRHLLIIVPANLRKQWAAELQEKFFLPSRILESRTYGHYVDGGSLNPFDCEQVVLCSYQFARTKADCLRRTAWDLVVIDEAHRLRNVYKPANKIANTLKAALTDRKKVLLTATPLQNSILELYGLTSIIDDYAFGDLKSFKMKYGGELVAADYDELRRRLAPLCKRTLRRQVLEYVRYTKRIAILQEFFPTRQEQQLYDLVSDYLQRPRLYALPNSQRKLMTLILRKLLASSTYAIHTTLCALIDRLTKKLAQEEPSDDARIADYESYDDDAEEWADDEAPHDDTPPTPHDLDCIRQEIASLERFRDLAYKIKRNSKAEQLFEGLDQGFAHLAHLGAPRKALIFTESRRTQDFLFRLLERRGYKGQVVLFNGSNADPLSRQIYADWKQRNAATPLITGSATADKRAAIVDHFRHHATIMVATEAAAEGINLQFCSLVVNYDMPWNPQRIEQRIGRCHRYGQEHDVVVINFLNKANAADVRVYELLDQKFQLFNGVFGTSDEVLGAIGNGVDFEKRIALIYQQCRTTKEIADAFDQLQTELQDEIADRMGKARTQLLENFDDAVREKLRADLAETRGNLSRFEAALWRLTQSYYAQKATFSAADHSFVLDRPVEDHVVDADGYIEYGRYVLPPATHRRGFTLPPDARPYRIGSPLARHMIATLKATPSTTYAVEFDYARSGLRVALLEKMVGQRGWMVVDRLTVQSFEQEDYLLYACTTDDGATVYPDVAEKMLSLNGRECAPPQPMPDDVRATLRKALDGQRADITARNADRDRQLFDDEMDKLDHWADDVKRGLEKEIRDLDAEIKLNKYAARRTSVLAEKLEIQRKVKDMEKLRSEKRLNLYHAQDEVDARKEALLARVEARLKQSITQTNVLTIRFKIA